VRLGFSSRGSKAWTLSSHWDTTWAKIWLGLSLMLVAMSFMAFLVFEHLMLVSLGAWCVAAQELDFHSEV
jgi:hypothetical protein